MTARATLRSLFYVAKDLRNGLFPLQAARVVLDRDFERRVRVAAAAHDAAEGLNEFEAENDGLPEFEAVSPDGYYGFAEPDLGGLRFRDNAAGSCDGCGRFFAHAPDCSGESDDLGPESEHVEALRLNEEHDGQSVRQAVEMGKRLADKALQHGQQIVDEYARAVGPALDAATRPIGQCKWCGGLDMPGHNCLRQYAERAVVDADLPYQIGRDIKVGEQYCFVCGEQLGEEYHACPVLAARRAAGDNPNFAGAAASLADDKSSPVLGRSGSASSVREDKQPGGLASTTPRPVDPHTDSAVTDDTADPPGGDESDAAPLPIAASPAAGHPNATPSVHDLRMAAGLLLSLPPSTDPRDYDFRALGERFSAAADHLEAEHKAFMKSRGGDGPW